MPCNVSLLPSIMSSYWKADLALKKKKKTDTWGKGLIVLLNHDMYTASMYRDILPLNSRYQGRRNKGGHHFYCLLVNFPEVSGAPLVGTIAQSDKMNPILQQDV